MTYICATGVFSEISLYVLWSEPAVYRCSWKYVLLKFSWNALKNNCVGVSFLMKLQASSLNFITKEASTQVFSCELCKIFNNVLFYRTSPVSALVWFDFCFPDYRWFWILVSLHDQYQLFATLIINLRFWWQYQVCCPTKTPNKIGFFLSLESCQF